MTNEKNENGIKRTAIALIILACFAGLTLVSVVEKKKSQPAALVDESRHAAALPAILPEIALPSLVVTTADAKPVIHHHKAKVLTLPPLPIAIDQPDQPVAENEKDEAPVVEEDIPLDQEATIPNAHNCVAKGPAGAAHAWVSCDGSLLRVKAGDRLPAPSGATVEAVNTDGTLVTSLPLIN